MKHDMNRLSLAIRLGLTAGIFAMAGIAQAQTAQADNPPSTDQAKPPSKNDAKTLKAVTVTGSLIRRVDVETASPVVTLDRSTINNSGKPVLGDVLQQMPAISGNATNPQNNSNGGGVASPLLEGGDGASRVSLRGLGINRTLVLVNGQRMANADINLIPPDMIERVDVLAEGASTVYGSDAIGGVVNFILRKDFKGVQFSLNDGISSHGDGQRRGFNLTAGQTGQNYSITGGIDYNKYDPVLGVRRKFSKQQLYLSSGSVVAAGSSSIPTGRIQLPGSIASQYGCDINSSGTANVTLAQGNGSSQSDYRCRLPSDTYNYAALNYIQTAQKRTNAFVLGSYDFSDNLSVFVDAFYNHTVSSGQDAPSPVGTGDGLIIPASNPINPFGVTFSQNPIAGDPNSGYNFQTRLTGGGTRVHSYTTDTGQINTGLRGRFGQESSWTWDATINYSHTKRDQRDTNEIDIPALQAAVDAGANIFDQADPSVSALLKKGVDTPEYVFTQATKQVQFDTSGELWDLPAGTIQLSAGALYRKQSMKYTVSSFAVLDPVTTTCQILQEACGSPGSGSFNVKEVFAETLIPLLSEQPLAYSLNLDLGVRTSNYSTTGTTTNGKIAIEWRPIADLLVRGTVSQVFRAPNLDELYDGRTLVQPTLNDPCAHLSAAQLAQHPAACQYVPPNWAGNSPAQVNTFYSGAATVDAKLKPEKGKSIDIGLVYDPSWLPGLSTSVDFWHIYLSDTLTAIQGDTVVSSCYNNNASPYCSFIHRQDNTSRQPGQVFLINTPVVNLGNLSTTGIDYTLRYKIPHFNLGDMDPGNFKASLSSSYTSTYKNSATPGEPGARTINYAGTYSQQFGNISRWRGTVTLNWNKGNWNAQWQSRYINKLTALNADAAISGVNIPMASVTYHSLQLGYAVPSIHTRFDVGVDNLSNKLPPLIYQNGANYNVDTATYDVLGRYYWARATVKF
ncbi:TonB-dependent receptor plug domain-containing protein [Rhodanobacter glycinis]|uniref:TonB-dependent Receptor Plug Domain n=1 Tax=Rhodanobacter glycinis TaxID=582702 RepID=A0A1I4DBV4_9GAMM|nr:TonB-dependent receptor [Rhodanobacter glycinis]SFK89606.1 TonB-dependent Receptor Plug Domain [Rhodanobacter glycinis]